MPKTTTKSLKIVLDTPHLSASDMQNIEQWENEGGLANKSIPKSEKPPCPIRKGDIIEIRGGDFLYENGELYYVTEIDILSREY